VGIGKRWEHADLLRRLREAKGWSQAQLAEVSGIKQQTIAHWELGDREPSASGLFAVCRALGVSCERFTTEGGEVAEPTPAKLRGRPKAEPTSHVESAKKPKSKGKAK